MSFYKSSNLVQIHYQILQSHWCTTLNMSTFYHLKTNGQIKMVNQVVLRITCTNYFSYCQVICLHKIGKSMNSC